MAKLTKTYNIPYGIIEFFTAKNGDIHFIKNGVVKPITELTATDRAFLQSEMSKTEKPQIDIADLFLQNFIRRELAKGTKIICRYKTVDLTQDDITLMKILTSKLQGNDMYKAAPFSTKIFDKRRKELFKKLNIPNSKCLGFIRANITEVKR